MIHSQKSKIKIVLVGGGTGGHFYPLMSIAESLVTHPLQPELIYMGPEKYDTEALAANAVRFVYTPAGKNRRYASLQNFFDLFVTLFGVVVAFCKLFIIYPDVVISKGGYTSVPVVLAAAFLRIPIVIHESDSVMGKANKLASRYARDIIITYEELAQTLSAQSVHTLGIPVRKALLLPPSKTAIQNLGIDPNRPLILILGGSQGAERINSLVLDSLNELLKDYSIVHQTGKQHFSICSLSADRLITDPNERKHYHPTPFLSGAMLNDAYHLAGIVISRAGSNSIYEIALHAKPAILIPIPEGISHDQRTNAYTYARRGGAIVMEESNLRDDLLHAEIDRIMQDEVLRSSMSESARAFAKRDAAEKISALGIAIAQEH